MTFFGIGFVTAAAFVFWFFRRRTKGHGNVVHLDGHPATGNTIAQTVGTAIIEHIPDLEQEAEGPGQKATEREMQVAVAPDTAGSSGQPLDVLCASPHQQAELGLGRDAHIANLDAGGRDEFGEHLPPDAVPLPQSRQASLETEKIIAGIGESSGGGKYVYVSEEPIVSASAPTGGRGEAFQPELNNSEREMPQTTIEHPDQIPESEADRKESVGRIVEEALARYKPPTQKPARLSTAGKASHEAERKIPSEVSLEIRVRLTFDRFDFCSMSFLPARTSELDVEIDVKSGRDPLRLVAQEDWYQDLQFDNTSVRLRLGLELKGLLSDHRPVRWLLTGRDLYVLASHQRASGFVSTSRLILGRSHVVLCLAELQERVEEILDQAGCQGYTSLDQSHGVPPGWFGLRNVSPAKAIPLLESDRFYAIKPAPDIEIELEGGLCLRNSVWLAGYPPRIKLYGQVNDSVSTLIDGKRAQLSEDGSLVAEGYDLSGSHNVYCEGLSCSRSYSIEEAPDSWEIWPAYHFGQADICGPLVQLKATASRIRVLSVPMSNPLLLGAEPGQVFRCSTRRGSHWKGFVPFEVVWALPSEPFLCDKRTARILEFADSFVVPSKTPARGGLAWSNAILEAARKGLRVENGSPHWALRWADFKRAARNIRRAAR